METHDVVNFLLKKGFQVTPEAAEYLKGTSRLEFQDLVKRIIRKKNQNNDDNFMVSMEDVRNNTIQPNVQDEVDFDDYEIIEISFPYTEARQISMAQRNVEVLDRNYKDDRVNLKIKGSKERIKQILNHS